MQTVTLSRTTTCSRLLTLAALPMIIFLMVWVTVIAIWRAARTES